MRIGLIISLICFVQVLYGQDKFLFKKIRTEEIQSIESENNGLIVDTVDYSLSLNNFSTYKQSKTKTYIYKRIDDDFFPKLHVWYHVDTTKNELVAITYNWDFYNPSFNPDKNRDLLISANKQEKEYQHKYSYLNELLRHVFDVPTKINLINDSEYSFSEMTYWENDNLYAYSRIRFQRTISESQFIGLAENHFLVQMVISFK